MKIFFMCVLFFSLVIQAQEYKIGQGVQLNKKLTVGAYFSTDYTKGSSVDKARLDDVAVLAYGNLSSQLSYFLELESAPTYVKDYKNHSTQTNLKFYYERAYGNYMYSDNLALRFGKFITPIGYWNLEPINVLRDTSSNPLYSSLLFPKFVTGVDLYGYVNEEDSLQYHLFLQTTNDIDEDYINIKNNFFLGSSLSYDISDEINLGATLGYFKTKDIKKDVFLAQINAKYDNYPYLLQTEWAYTDIKNKTLSNKAKQFGGYLQGMYNFTQQHAIVGRYEYFDDTQTSTLIQQQHIGIIGYSYRPVYAVSIKAEYQFNSHQELNKAIISFSVLF
ncbi:outer membrane beta-barrel protein [Sulfurimonas sp.]